MKITIRSTTFFDEERDNLIKKRKLLKEDYDDFEKSIAHNPTSGDVIRGTGGARKTRLASVSKGKSGGFRVCYFYHQKSATIYLLVIFPKNVKENLASSEIQEIKQIIIALKRKLDG